MSIQAVAWALEQNLPARPKLVLVSIANHANHVDGYCFLKAETIAREAACTTRSIYRFIGGLVRNGYIRKVARRAEDGKQRANDYWITFERDEKPWDWGAHPDEDVADDGAVEGATADAEPQDIVEPHEGISHGENVVGVSPQPVEKHAVSPGPCDSGVSHKRIAEPSESNSKASSAGARVRDAALRSYRPPPPQPLGADPALPTKQVFAYEGSRAYDAWAKVEAKKAGLRNWHLATRALVDGQWRSGWYFPTLFPPDDSKSTDPPKESSAA